jgi:outer membrane protein OmpA-like peptidoglycan-associated protein
VAGLCAVASVLAVVMMVRAHGAICRTQPATIIDADQVTAEEGYDPMPPAGLVSRAQALASCSGGELALVRVAGQGGTQGAAPVSLRVYREPGEAEHDAVARQDAVRRLIDGAFRAALATPVRGAGRDVITLLATVSADLGRGQNDVWLRTLGLPTVAPADARILMAADPVQAAASIAQWVPKLPGAQVHLILSPSAGDQPWLNTATDAWRRAFMLALLHEAGAHVVSVTDIQVIEKPARGAPTAPPVANLPEATPRPPRPHPGKPYRLILDSSAFFLPNSTRFAASGQQAVTSLQPIIRVWRSGGYARVTVVGHCARFGPPHGALVLSRRRAQVIASLLHRAGVREVTAVGVGYSQPLPPNPYSAKNRVVIVTVYPKT